MGNSGEKQNKLVFVDLSVNGFYFTVNHGLAALVPIVKKNGFDVSLIYLDKDISAKKFKKIIEKIKPAVVGFTLMWPQLKYLIKYSRAISEIPNLLKICGGPGATLSPLIVLEKAELDGVCIGDGEVPLTELLTKINNNEDILETNGFYWQTPGGLKKNPIPQFVSDLSVLPFPDYSLYPRSLVVQYEGKNLSVKLGRGCPFNCSYCSNKNLSAVHPSSQPYFRLPPVTYAIDQIKNLISRYPEAQQINFSDETITANKAWFTEFIERYTEEIGLRYTLMTRMDCLDGEIIELMKNTHCYFVWVGLESGDEKLRSQILGRYYSNEMFIEKAKLLKAAGIKIYTYNMFALPFETKEQMEKTVQLNMKIKADQGQCSFYYPFPGTKLYDLCRQNHLLLAEEEMIDLNNYNSRPAIKLTHATEADCFRAWRKLAVYFAQQEDNPWFRMNWYRCYEEDGTFLTNIRLSIFYTLAKTKYLIKKSYLALDRQLGNLGIFLKNNYPKIYYSIRSQKNPD